MSSHKQKSVDCKHSHESVKNIFSKSSFITGALDDGEEVDVTVAPEKCSIVMAIDNTPVGLYVIYYYLKKIHKPDNFVHACFVSDDFISARTQLKHGDGVPNTKSKKCCKCFKRTLGAENYVVDVGPSPGVLAELRKVDRSACLKVKHRIKHLLTKNDVEWDFRRLRGADPGKAILDYRNTIGADVIVMGSRGTSLLGKLKHGNTSTTVLNNSLVPVLVVRKPQGAMETYTVNKESSIG